MALSREFVGLVIKATGSWYTVVNRETAETIECKIRGKIRLKDVKTTNPVVVGKSCTGNTFWDTVRPAVDFVEIENTLRENGGDITEVDL